MKFLPSLSSPTSSAACAVLLSASIAFPQAPRTAEPCVVTPVKTSLAADAPSVSIVVEHGRIARIVPVGDPLPAAVRVIDGKDQLAVPAFVDAASWSGCVTPEPRIDQDLPTDLEADVQVDMRAANRKGIEPAFRAAGALDFTPDEQSAWREAGFGLVLAAPHGQILGGTSALIVTRAAASRDAVLIPEVFAHAAFAATGPGYPSTLMGYTAQLRQLFLDAQHHDELAARALAGRPGPRPAFDPELEALAPVLRRERRVACEAQVARDIDRWLALGDELGFDVAIVGGNQAFERAEVLAAKRVPVILTLEWGDEPDDPDAKKPDATKDDATKPDAKKDDATKDDATKDDATKDEAKKDEAKKDEAKPGDVKAGDAKAGEAQGEPAKGAEVGTDASKPAETPTGAATQPDGKRYEYEEPLGVRRAKRARWVERRDCAKVLAEKGVRIAFGTAGGNASDLLGKVRKMVEAGLPRDVALRALSSGAVEVLGASKLGALEPGNDADFALWTADPLSKDARLAWLLVDGFAHEFDLTEAPPLEGAPDEGVDASGVWTVDVKSPDAPMPPQKLDLEMKPDGTVTGTLTATNPMDQQPMISKLTGRVAKKQMRLSAKFDLGELQIDAEYDGELAGDSWSGTLSVKGSFGEQKLEFKGTKKPQ
ncbi:MAG: amidohydrolase family protein [Planctomycetes bacterium]|nr:amidohydrolase family protein [Planctomycetota bacterium]